jgi:hypothetical protein
MNFKISALSPEPFNALFSLSDTQLKHRNILKQTVTKAFSTPCRVSLEDANIGDTVLLLNYQHINEQTPFQAAHAIYIRKGVKQAYPAVNEVPEMIHSRVVSLRSFDSQHMMIAADLATAEQVTSKILTLFSNPSASYLHLHYAKQGCYIAKVNRC